MDVEHCLFPMNLPLPDFHQPVLAFGGAASMVHPASGYMVGALLRRGPGLAEALAAALNEQPAMGSAALARVGWQALWPNGVGVAPSPVSVWFRPFDGLR
jgi:lycopene beta-cyclase